MAGGDKNFQPPFYCPLSNLPEKIILDHTRKKQEKVIKFLLNLKTVVERCILH